MNFHIALAITLLLPPTAWPNGNAERCATPALMRSAAQLTSLSTPDDTLKPGEFNFIFVSNTCMKDSINTWSGRITRTTSSSISIPLLFTQAELARIRDAMLNLRILDIRQNEGGDPECDSILQHAPQTLVMSMGMFVGASGYYDYMMIRYQTTTVEISYSDNEYTVAWIDGNGQGQERHCNRKSWYSSFHEFTRFIENTIRTHPEIRELPQVGCL